MNKVFQLAPIHQPLLSKFYADCLNDPKIAPYLDLYGYSDEWTVDTSTWSMIQFGYGTTDRLYGYAHYRPVRSTGYATVALWSMSPIGAGRLVKALKDSIYRSSVEYVQVQVMESNMRSLALCRRIFGPPWGILPNGAHNIATGQNEDLYHFAAPKLLIMQQESFLS